MVTFRRGLAFPKSIKGFEQFAITGLHAKLPQMPPLQHRLNVLRLHDSHSGSYQRVLSYIKGEVDVLDAAGQTILAELVAIFTVCNRQSSDIPLALFLAIARVDMEELAQMRKKALTRLRFPSDVTTHTLEGCRGQIWAVDYPLSKGYLSGEDITDCTSYLKTHDTAVEKREKQRKKEARFDPESEETSSSDSESNSSSDSDRSEKRKKSKSKRARAKAAVQSPEPRHHRAQYSAPYRSAASESRPFERDKAGGVCGRCGKIGHRAIGCTGELHPNAKDGDPRVLLDAIRAGTVPRPTTKQMLWGL